jgi:hypothetical protein
MIQIKPQFYKTHSGARPLTYAIYLDGVFCGYCRCWCRAERAAKYLSIRMMT